jgi:hypothetical protein
MAVRTLATVVLVLVTVVPCGARADELALSASSVCDLGALPAEIEAALGRSLAPGEPTLHARIAMRREGGRVRAVVGLDRDDARSERSFSAPDCAHATHAAALVLALALGTVPAAPVSAAPVVAPTPALALDFETQLFIDDESVAASTTPIAPTPTAPRVRVHVLASALIDAGSLPGLDGGARLGLGLSFAPLLVEMDATYVSASRAASAQPGASVDLVLAFGTIRGGARWEPWSWLGLGAAAELDVGAMSGTGAGVRLDRAATATLPWMALRGALLVELIVDTALAIRASGSIGTPLVAPSFEVMGVGSAFSSSPVLWQGALGLVVHLS